MARTYLKIFFDFEQRTAELTAEEQGRLLLALLHYASSGEKEQLAGNERFLFPSFCMDIDRDVEVYESKVAGGKQGGRPKKDTHAKPAETMENHLKPEETSFKNKNKEEEKEYEEEYENEKEKEYEKEGVKEKGAKAQGADALTTLSSLFSQYSFSSALQQSLEDWVQYKAERQEGYMERGLKALLRQIDSNVSRYGEEAVRELMELSMASGWKGIIFDRLKDSPPQKEPCNPDDYYKGPKFGWGFEDEEEREWNLCES